MMSFISRKVHRLMDYLSGLLLIASPWIFGFQTVNNAKAVAIVFGAVILLLSLLTDYTGRSGNIIPMDFHLKADVVMGIVLAASPWLFGFSDRTYWFHLVMGLLELIAGLFTVSRSSGNADTPLADPKSRSKADPLIRGI